jgi:rRNA maturation endonuclease Nob1
MTEEIGDTTIGLRVLDRVQSSIENLTKAEEEVRTVFETANKLLQEDHVQARLRAEEELRETKDELERTKAMLKQSKETNRRHAKYRKAMREALRGHGRNPMIDHARQVFEALVEAAPDHPLVTRDLEDTSGVYGFGEHAKLYGLEARLIWQALGYAQERMSESSCTDFFIEDATKQEAFFMRRISRRELEHYSHQCQKCFEIIDDDDLGKVRCPHCGENMSREWKEGDRIEGDNWTVVMFLRDLLVEIFGETNFEDDGRISW